MIAAPMRIGRVSRALLPLLVLFATGAAAQNARELIDESLRRHVLPPYVYQEQTLVLGDSLGQNTVRTLRYYARRDANGTKRLAVINTPEELRGMAVLITRDAKGGDRHGPAPASPLFGSNLTVADFEGEQPADFTYEFEEGQDLDRVSHHVLKATPKDADISRATGYGVRRLYLRKDNLFLSRVDTLDRQGRLARRLTFRDTRPDENGVWRAGMILAEDLREERRTLLKVDRRVHSADYVPDSVFGQLRGQLREQSREQSRRELRSELRQGLQ